VAANANAALGSKHTTNAVAKVAKLVLKPYQQGQYGVVRLHLVFASALPTGHYPLPACADLSSCHAVDQ